MTTKSPVFKDITASLDVDDATLDALSQTLGVPRMVAPATTRNRLEKLTVELPDYLNDALRRTALDRRTSVRHVVMLALQKSGFEIEPGDLVADGRRSRRKIR